MKISKAQVLCVWLVELWI